MTKRFYVVDTHTEGEPTRIVFWNWRIPPGKDVAEAREYIKKNYDWVRTSVMWEPRGHKDQFGAILLPPYSEEADYSIIWMDTKGYLDMCGHGTIGVTTALIELGFVEAKEPTTEIIFDTPAGIVRAKAHVENGRVKSVTIVDVPSFYVTTVDLKLEKPERKTVEADISFGGNFFVIVRAEELGMEVRPENTAELVDAALHIRDVANRTLKVAHPEKPYIDRIELAIISGKPMRKDAHEKSITVFAKGSVDRSPCGTGTASKTAVLYAKGKIKLGEEFVHESILGTIFRCKPIKETRVGNYKAIIPEITARAWVVQTSLINIEDDDPLKYGFFLKTRG